MDSGRRTQGVLRDLTGGLTGGRGVLAGGLTGGGGLRASKHCEEVRGVDWGFDWGIFIYVVAIVAVVVVVVMAVVRVTIVLGLRVQHIRVFPLFQK